MKKIKLLLVMSLFWLNSSGQAIKLRTEVKDTPMHVKTKITKRPVLLYFMAGFDDSVCVYYNKKMVLCSFIESISTLGHSYGISPLKLNYNDYESSHLLELKFIKSKKVYCVKLVRGYLCALIYLRDDPKVVIFTHESPMLE